MDSEKKKQVEKLSRKNAIIAWWFVHLLQPFVLVKSKSCECNEQTANTFRFFASLFKCRYCCCCSTRTIEKLKVQTGVDCFLTLNPFAFERTYTSQRDSFLDSFLRHVLPIKACNLTLVTHFISTKCCIDLCYSSEFDPFASIHYALISIYFHI